MDDLSLSKGLDFRTNEGQREFIKNKIRRDGGFSVFWATENQKRAIAITDLFESGEIINEGGDFPWHKVSLPLTPPTEGE